LNGYPGTGFELLTPVSLIAGAARFVRQDIYRSRLLRSSGNRNQCASLVSLPLACAPESKSTPMVVSLSGLTGTRSKRNFHRPESNCGIALNSTLHFPSFHSVSTMAAATNPTATPIKGLSTANQKETFHSGFSGFEFLFMLFSQAPEGRNFTKT
jgi:hypothetical protein